MDKRHQQLGMNPSTASNRLVKDLLFDLVKSIPCFHCGEKLTRETFSIEHKTPWLDAENAKELFFDLKNISYSHHSCNMSAARKPTKKWESEKDYRRWKDSRRVYNPAARRERYERLGT